MKPILALASIIALASCTTTVKRLTIKGYEMGDDRFSAYYELVEEKVPSYKGQDYASHMLAAAPDGNALQLFPTLTITRVVTPGNSRLTVSHDMLKPVGQMLMIDGDTALLSAPVFQISSATMSPNGKTVAFSCQERPDSPWTIWLVGADGRDPRMLCNGRDPDWSASGKLVFCTRKDGKHVIMTSSSDGGAKTIMLSSDQPLRHVAVNQVNGNVAFVKTTTADGSDGDVWLYDQDKESSIPVTVHPARDDAPVWSADGKRLYFRSTRSGSWGIWFSERLDGGHR